MLCTLTISPSFSRLTIVAVLSIIARSPKLLANFALRHPSHLQAPIITMALQSPHRIDSAQAISTGEYQQILRAARQLYESEPDWVTFFREVLGIDGVVRRQFTRL